MKKLSILIIPILVFSCVDKTKYMPQVAIGRDVLISPTKDTTSIQIYSLNENAAHVTKLNVNGRHVPINIMVVKGLNSPHYVTWANKEMTTSSPLSVTIEFKDDRTGLKAKYLFSGPVHFDSCRRAFYTIDTVQTNDIVY